MSPAVRAVRRALAPSAVGTFVAVLVGAAVVGPAAPSWAAAPATTPAVAAVAQPAGAATTPGFTSVTPTRLLDTRGNLTTPTLGPAKTVTVKVTGVAGVPATGVEAVSLNVTAIAATHATYVTVYPAGTVKPTASNLNVGLRRTRANAVIARVGLNGAVTLYNSSGSTDILVDISGWFATGSSFTSQAPVRVLDTRSNGGAARPAASTLNLQLTGRGGVPPISAGVTGVVLNLTAISTLRGTFVTAYPTGSPRPLTSNMNLVGGQTAAILVFAKPSAAGQITLYNSGGPTHLIVDVAGWFTGSADYTPLTPTRLLDTRITGGFTTGFDWPLPVGGQGGVPAGAGAVVLTVTVVNPDKQGHLTVHPGGTPEPLASNLNVHGAETTANLVVAQLAADGRIAIANRSHDHGLLVDVVGWLAGNQQLALVAPTVPTGLVDEPYSLVLQATSGRAPYTWTVAGGALPAGLSLSAAGKVTGSPTTPGTAFAIFRVTDAAGQTLVTTQQTFTTYPRADVWVWGQDVQNTGALPGAAAVRPVELPSAVGAKAIAVGPANGASSCGQVYALQPDGTVLAWGGGAHGALGNNAADNAPASAAVPVSGLTDVTEVAALTCGGYALKSDGTVWAWGNGKGLGIGDGTNTDSLVPVQVTALTDVTAIAAGALGGYAIKSDGTLWAWGDNSVGQLGNGGVADNNVPVQVTGLTDVTAVTGGFRTAYAIVGSGDLYAWGAGDAGELGDGTTTAEADVPVQVGLSDVTSVGAGMDDGYAALADGTVWAWGAGDSGELGNGDVVSSASPTQVSGLTDAVTVAGAKSNGFAVTSDGSIWAWGAGGNRMLGDGVAGSTNATSPVAVLVPSASTIATNSAGAAVFAIGPS